MMRRALALVMTLSLAFGCNSDDKISRGTNAALNAANREDQRVEVAGGDYWYRGEVVKRLREAGLVVSDSVSAVHRDGVHVAGIKLDVSGSPLEIYVYPTGETREHDSAALDTLPDLALPTGKRPRYIFSGNLIAIHITPKEALAERVENVLTARHAGAP
jgi:hypothetical protein